MSGAIGRAWKVLSTGLSIYLVMKKLKEAEPELKKDLHLDSAATDAKPVEPAMPSPQPMTQIDMMKSGV